MAIFKTVADEEILRNIILNVRELDGERYIVQEDKKDRGIFTFNNRGQLIPVVGVRKNEVWTASLQVAIAGLLKEKGIDYTVEHRQFREEEARKTFLQGI